MYRRKLFISFLLALASVLSGISLGWAIADEDRHKSIVYSLHLTFALYAFLLSVRAVRHQDTDSHSESILHLTALTTVACLLLGVITILPESPAPVKALSVYHVIRLRSYDPPIEEDAILMGLWYTLVFVYAIACIVIFRTPLGPLLYYPPSNIYSEKTVQSITNTDENNVAGIISLSISQYTEFWLIKRSRCISLGLLTLFLYNKSRLAWEHRR